MRLYAREMEMSDLYQLGRRLAEIALADLGADELGVTAGEFLVLQDLFLNGQSTIGEIAKRTGLAQSRVSTSVQGFAERDWAFSEPDPADRRRTLVRLTDEVRSAGERRRAARADRTLAAALTAAGAKTRERAGLEAALERLHELLVAGE
jgi:MarR family 2-MHQ and catechol resistance regulon transcriptional repressor